MPFVFTSSSSFNSWDCIAWKQVKICLWRIEHVIESRAFLNFNARRCKKTLAIDCKREIEMASDSAIISSRWPCNFFYAAPDFLLLKVHAFFPTKYGGFQRMPSCFTYVRPCRVPVQASTPKNWEKFEGKHALCLDYHRFMIMTVFFLRPFFSWLQHLIKDIMHGFSPFHFRCMYW